MRRNIREEADFGSFVKKYSEQFAARRPLVSRVDPHLYEVVYIYERTGN